MQDFILLMIGLAVFIIAVCFATFLHEVKVAPLIEEDERDFDANIAAKWHD